MVVLEYDKGTILIRGEVSTPYGRWDPRVRAFRALGINYKNIIDFLKSTEVEFEDDVLNLIDCPKLSCDLKLHPFQVKALNFWLDHGGRGIIVLPPGSGKTIIALKAISILNQPTLIVVPTIDLVNQWKGRVENLFGIEVGVYGGGVKKLAAITVSTYDSAYLYVSEFGDKFSFVVFDEVHHLAAPGYRSIAEFMPAPYRMGLTATFERSDGLHVDLYKLVGGKVFELKVNHLSGKYLSKYKVHRIFVDLTREEESEYNKQYSLFKSFLRKRGLKLIDRRDFKKFIYLASRDDEARRALLARNRAMEIALNSEGKINLLSEILRENSESKTIIFTQHNQLAYLISKRFLIPIITHKTSKSERSEILEKFRRGDYRVIVTSKVLEEGIDVPDADLAIILSGTGSSREFIQRLGRILRRKEGKEARLIEIVSKRTVEVKISKRRKKHASI